MHFDYSLKIRLPIDVVYKILRDELPKLAQYLPNVEKIEPIERKESEDKIYTLHKWYGKNILPPSINQFIRFDVVAWLDKGEWAKNEYVCNWSYEPFIFQEYINVKGQAIYSTDGTYTTIKFFGDVYINLDKYPFIIVVPSIMRKKDFRRILKFNFFLDENKFLITCKRA